MTSVDGRQVVAAVFTSNPSEANFKQETDETHTSCSALTEYMYARTDGRTLVRVEATLLRPVDSFVSAQKT